MEEQALQNACKLIRIAPGEIVIFNENIVHQVLKRKMASFYFLFFIFINIINVES
jgi:hypothetical protein